MKFIGITGGIGSGKSFVAQIIERMGYPVYYADKEARILMNSHPIISESLIDWFGTEIYSNGELNREKMAICIFHDEQMRSKVNQLVHPLVREAFVNWASCQNKPLVFNEAAILYETDAYKKFHEIILVTAPLSLRISRVMNRDGISEEQIRDRMEAQWSDDKKLSFGPYEIINDNRLPLLSQIEEVIEQLLKSDD
ncbi:MAG: dephospho-CoA kinase [Crocinitomicaceae bacterium]